MTAESVAVRREAMRWGRQRHGVTVRVASSSTKPDPSQRS
jgi:hypothetical protein